jgi:tripeptide aminopeptidase
MQLARLLERCLEIQAVPSPTFGEGERALVLRQHFLQAGLQDVEFDETGNVYGRLGDSPDRPIVLAAHLDSVFPSGTDLHVIRNQERWAGPGVGDNALGLATLVELAFDLADPRLPRPVWFVGTVGEEGLGNLRGMTGVVGRFGSEPVAYIAVEGMSLGYVYNRALPVRRYKLDVHGPGGHPWIHPSRPSALHQLLRLSERLLDLPLPAEPKTTLNIGQMHGGSVVNTIARHAWMEFEIRSEEAPTLADLARSVEAGLQGPWPANIEVKVELVGQRPAGALAEDHVLVRAACESFQAECGRTAQLVAGSTDASLPLSLGYPAICVGVTTGSNAHTLMESIDLEPIPQGYASLLGLVRRIHAVTV